MKDRERLMQAAFPMPSLRRGTAVKIRAGTGWTAATVEKSTRSFVVVLVGPKKKTVTVWDARSISVGV